MPSLKQLASSLPLILSLASAGPLLPRAYAADTVFTITVDIPQQLTYPDGSKAFAQYEMYVDQAIGTKSAKCVGDYDDTTLGEQPMTCFNTPRSNNAVPAEGLAVRVQQPNVPSRLPKDGGVNFLINWDGVLGRIDFPAFKDNGTVNSNGFEAASGTWRKYHVEVPKDKGF